MTTENPTLFAGVDVSAAELHLAVQGHPDVLVFANDASGHHALVQHLRQHANELFVVMEATADLHLDLALFLSAEEGVSVHVAQPMAAKAFHASLMRRAKTDRVDAHCLAEMGARLDLTPWTVPSETVLRVRYLARRLGDLRKMKTAEKNRAKAMQKTTKAPPDLIAGVQAHLEFMETQVEAVRTALRETLSQEAFGDTLDTLQTLPGLGERNTPELLAEFLLLPADLNGRQVTAYAGLDPRPAESGVRKGRRRISKRGRSSLRAPLYMASLNAVRAPGPLRDFYERVTLRTGSKKSALVATSRKLLVIAWAMFQSGEPWRGRAEA